MSTLDRKHTLLVEKYRPDSLEGYIGNEKLKDSIKLQLEKNDIQNYTFHGKAGGGKTTLAKIIVENLDCESLFINASDENGIDTVRDKIKNFAATVSFAPIKVVVLDEADFLMAKAQAPLRALIEQFSRSTRFLLTCNYIDRIIEPLQSRCEPVKIVPPTRAQVAKHAAWILEQEEIDYDQESLVVLVNKFFPDIRRLLNNIQSNSRTGKLVVSNDLITSSHYLDQVIKELSNPKPNFKSLRQIIADSNENNFDELFRYLYDNDSKVMPGKEGTLSVLVNETAYESNFALDKEINCMSLIQKIINNK